jgi:hypothetical protein
MDETNDEVVYLWWKYEGLPRRGCVTAQTWERGIPEASNSMARERTPTANVSFNVLELQ